MKRGSTTAAGQAPPLQELIDAGVQAHRRGSFAEAQALYRAALKQQPQHAQLLHLLGVACCSARDFRQGVHALEQALKLTPGSIQVRTNLGCALRDLGKHRDALRCFDALISSHPDHAPAHNDRGVTLAALGRHEEALGSYAEALRLRPDFGEAIYNQGNARAAQGNPLAALERYELAATILPGLPQVWKNRGHALKQLQRDAQALASYERCLTLGGGDVDVYLACAKVLERLFRLADAVVACQRALEREPDNVAAHDLAGFLLYRLSRCEEARHHYDQVKRLKPAQPYVAGMSAFIRRMLCDWRSADAQLQAVLDELGRNRPAVAPWVLLALTGSPSQQLACARQAARREFAASSQPLWSGARYANPRIRVAYLSADFHDHATMHLMAGLFEQHDRTRFETVAISFGPDFSDSWRARLVASVDRFEDLRLCSDREIAARIRELEVDIAVDLKGHTSDARPGILQHRPAPVQVSYLGFPGTTGLSEMDYLIADRVLVPESDELFYTEKIVRLPDSYQVNDNQRPISPQTFTRAQLGLPAQSFIFCCFNNSYKITPEVFAVWMRLLHGVEGSVLWLLADSPAVQRNLRDEAARQGVEPQRLIFASRLAPAEHLARLQLADLFLDTLPCNAHTTASDSLWAGLPILTCAGESFAGRVCASLLTAVGLPELVSPSLQAYEALARELATDSVKYQGIRERLAANRSRAALFDTRRFTRHLEQAYCIVRERQLRGEAPASFSVEASPESPGVSP